MNKKTTEHENTDSYYNETSNTEAGINTPKDREGIAATDMISGAVQEIVDHVQRTFEGKPEPGEINSREKRERPET